MHDAVPLDPLSGLPAAARGAAFADAARDMIASLSRAVQRATIYPPDHPAVRAATAPLLTTLARCMDRWGGIQIGVTRERLYVGPSPEETSPVESAWLSARLADRGVAALRLEPGVSAEGLDRTIGWIAKTVQPGDAVPTFDGVSVVPLDLGAARFRESPVESDRSPAAVAWRVMAAWLAGEDEAAAHVPADPAALAALVLDTIERNEGTGVAALETRLTSLHRDLEAVSDATRAELTSRLASFVAALAPELRRQLLAASPADRLEKLSLLGRLAGDLPPAATLDVIERLDFQPGEHVDAFVSLVLDVAGLAAQDANLARAFSRRCVEQGLPADLVFLDTAQARRVLQQVLSASPPPAAAVEPPVPSPAESPAARARGLASIDMRRHVNPAEVADVSAGTALVALHVLAATAAGDPTRPACAERVGRHLPQWFAAGNLDAVSMAADAVLAARADTATPEDPAAAFFSSPSTIGLVLDAIVAAEEQQLDSRLVTIARAGGRVMADRALVALSWRPDRALCARLGRLLGALDADDVRTSASALLRREPARARNLLGSLNAAGDVPVLADVGFTFLADEDPAVRLDAVRWLTAIRLSTVRFETALRRALEDGDPRVTSAAVEAAARRTPPVGLRALAAFIDAADSSAHEHAQQRAATVLARAGTPETRALLVSTLAGRGRRLDAPSRRVSRALTQALERLGGEQETAAARAWRRSPAGMLSRMMNDAAGDPA